jgi:hypothetical protein
VCIRWDDQEFWISSFKKTKNDRVHLSILVLVMWAKVIGLGCVQASVGRSWLCARMKQQRFAQSNKGCWSWWCAQNIVCVFIKSIFFFWYLLFMWACKHWKTIWEECVCRHWIKSVFFFGLILVMCRHETTKVNLGHVQAWSNKA